jgi:hypothetical protein
MLPKLDPPKSAPFTDSLRGVTVLTRESTLSPYEGSVLEPAIEHAAVITRLYDPIYGKRVYLLHGERSACEKFLSRQEGNGQKMSLGSGGGHAAIHAHEQVVFAWVEERCDPSTPAGLGLIVHECHHATCRVMQAVGMQLCFESEEAYTYYIHWLVESWLTSMDLEQPQLEALLGKRLEFVCVDSLDSSPA